MTAVPDGGPEPWASDDNVPTRQPAFCPYCGQDGAFDGLGSRSTGSGETQYRNHCPECGYEFITIHPTAEDDVDG